MKAVMTEPQFVPDSRTQRGGETRASGTTRPTPRGLYQHVRPRWPAIAVAALCGALFALGLTPVVAFANPSSNRTRNTTINGFGTNGVSSAAVDGSDNVWITDGGQSGTKPPGIAGVYKYDPFPSQELLAVPQTYGVWSPGEYLWLDAAVDNSTGEIFVGQANGREVDIYDPTSAAHECEANEPVCFSHKWTRINGALSC